MATVMALEAKPPWHERLAMIEAALASGDLKIVFIVGMARSGTTWLSQLLKQHDAVSSLGETHLFNGFLGQIPRALRHYAGRPGTGIQVATSEEDFVHWVRELVLRTLTAPVSLGSWPRVIVEKTPPHSFHLPFINRLLPEAYYLNIVRDPRAVAASWHAAARGWAEYWAKRSTIQLAMSWNKIVTDGLAIPTFTDRYHFMQYETLHARPVETMGEVFAWLGLPVEPETCARFVDACSFEKLREAKSGSPERRVQFFRSGKVDSWRKDLSRLQVARIEYIDRRYMERLGYQRSGTLAPFLPSLALYWAAYFLERGSRKLARHVRA